MADYLSLAELAVDILAADRELVDEHVLGHHAPGSPPEATHAARLARAFRPGLTALESRYTTQTAILALQMTASRGRIVAHTPNQTAIDRVHSTDLHALPTAPPRLLDGPWIIEVNDPLKEQLWAHERGRVIAVAGHVTDDGLCLSVLEPQRRSTGVWTPSWGGTDDEIIDGLRGTLVLAAGNESAAPHHRAMMEQAVRFSLVLVAMLDAEGTPLRVRDEERAPPRQMRKAGLGTSKYGRWRRTYVTLDPKSDPVLVAREVDNGGHHAFVR